MRFEVILVECLDCDGKLVPYGTDLVLLSRASPAECEALAKEIAKSSSTYVRVWDTQEARNVFRAIGERVIFQ